MIHCTDKIPKIRNNYSQERNCAATVPISKFMFLWAIYIFLWPVWLFCCRKIGWPNVGIYRSPTDTWMWKLGLRLRNSFSWNTYIQIALQCTLCMVYSFPMRQPWLQPREVTATLTIPSDSTLTSYPYSYLYRSSAALSLSFFLVSRDFLCVEILEQSIGARNREPSELGIGLSYRPPRARIC